MKKAAYITLTLALISLILGIISRVTLIPIPLVAGSGLQANAFLRFTDTCLLFTVILILLEKK